MNDEQRREYMREYMRQWRARNPDKVRALSRAYDATRERPADWREKHKAHAREYQQQLRASGKAYYQKLNQRIESLEAAAARVTALWAAYGYRVDPAWREFDAAVADLVGLLEGETR